MNQATMTRLINWCGLAIAVVLLALVSLHIYKKHFLLSDQSTEYLFNDLPTQATEAVKGNIPAIVQAHIMGEVPVVAQTEETKEVVKVAPPPPPPPKTKLNIVLTGIIDGATPETGFAMIEIQRGKTAVIGVGEEIGKTGAVLHQVLPGEVLVDRDGTIESVKMKRNTLELAMQLPDESLIDLMDESMLPLPSAELQLPYAELPAPSAGITNSVNQNDVSVNLNQELTNEERQAIRARALNEAAQKRPGVMSELPTPKRLLTL